MPPKKPRFEPVKHHPLKRWRFEHDVGLVKLAELLDSSQGYLSQVESGKKFPTVVFAKKVCDLTGLDLEDFAPGDG